MNSLNGETVSHYKILEKLGEGGMGVVYKAEYTRLTRTVALKFLPHGLDAHEPERARFLQEARAAAILNHPNICTVYDIQEHDGKQFIVMECVEGKLLREIVPVKKTADAISYAIQIAEALQEAHGNGIVHRDIKAENIMINSKNQVKVMDFGLAKLKGSLKLTKTSSTIGTLAYMAPEQIQGGEVDARSDIFSFGVVLFEMLTGHLPFRGEHEAAMVYSIVHEEPESITALRPDVPSEVVHIIDKALEKDPADRFQSAADMVADLRRALRQSSRIPGATAHIARQLADTRAISTPPVQSPLRRRVWLGVGGLVVVAVMVCAYLLFTSNGSTSVPRLNTNMTMRVLSVPSTQMSYAGISPDGNWIAYPAPDRNNLWDVYYMHVSGTAARRITADSSRAGNNLGADISPDGSQVAYLRYKTNFVTQICVTSALGGVCRVVADSATSPRWRPDGERIGYVRPRRKGGLELWSVKPDASDNRLEFSDSLTLAGRYSFSWSPDGRSVAWIRTFAGGNQEVIAREIVTGAEKQLTFDGKNIDDAYWSRKGVIVFSSNRGGNTNLWMVPVAGGTPQQITKGGGRISALACRPMGRGSCTFSNRTSATSGSRFRMVPPHNR